MSYYACDTAPGTHDDDDCVRVPAGVRNMALITEEGYAGISDFTNLSQWTAQEAAGELIYLRRTRGSKPVSSPNLTMGYGGPAKRLTGREHTAEVFMAANPANRDFWNTVSKNSGYHVALQVGDGSSKYNLISTVPANVVCDVDAPEDYNGELSYKISITWSSVEMPLYEADPAGNYA